MEEALETLMCLKTGNGFLKAMHNINTFKDYKKGMTLFAWPLAWDIRTWISAATSKCPLS